MGSSHPAIRDRQSSIRKEISRLLEDKGKTIAYDERWSFLFYDQELPFSYPHANPAQLPVHRQFEKFSCRCAPWQAHANLIVALFKVQILISVAPKADDRKKVELKK